MELNQLFKERRSVRRYKDVAIPSKDIAEIVKASQQAPSWKNMQSARFYAANTPESKAAVMACLPDFNQNNSRNASYIVTTFKKGLSGRKTPTEMSPEGDYWGAYDLGLNNSYLVLKAKELGYDTLIMGLRDTDALRKVFDIPEDEMILPVIALGVREGSTLYRERNSVEQVLTIK